MYNEFHKQHQRLHAARRKERVNGFKAKPCADCGVLYPPHVMDFDHRPGETKLFNLAYGYRKPWLIVLAEIAKCDVVCANCHRIRTFSRLVRKPQRLPGNFGPPINHSNFPCGHFRIEENICREKSKTTKSGFTSRCKLCNKSRWKSKK